MADKAAHDLRHDQLALGGQSLPGNDGDLVHDRLEFLPSLKQTDPQLAVLGQRGARVIKEWLQRLETERILEAMYVDRIEARADGLQDFAAVARTAWHRRNCLAGRFLNHLVEQPFVLGERTGGEQSAARPENAVHLADGKRGLGGVVDSETARRQIVTPVLMRKGLVEIECLDGPASSGVLIEEASLRQQFFRDVPAGEVRLTLQIVIEGSQLFS